MSQRRIVASPRARDDDARSALSFDVVVERFGVARTQLDAAGGRRVGVPFVDVGAAR